MEMFEVGGCVRDELLGVKSKDIDYSVVLNDVEKMLCEQDDIPIFDFLELTLLGKGFDIFELRPQYLTIRAKFPKGPSTIKSKRSGLTADFVLARKESDYTDGRRPDKVEPGTLMDDLARRDFTMNAIAKAADGTLIDPFNGQWDIEHRIIRAVGDPRERFTEDALRIVRAMRFAVTKDFKVEYQTEKAMRDLAPTVAGVSADRVREELTKMFNVDPLLTIRVLEEYEMFPIIFNLGINFQPTLKKKIR